MHPHSLALFPRNETSLKQSKLAVYGPFGDIELSHNRSHPFSHVGGSTCFFDLVPPFVVFKGEPNPDAIWGVSMMVLGPRPSPQISRLHAHPRPRRGAVRWSSWQRVSAESRRTEFRGPYGIGDLTREREANNKSNYVLGGGMNLNGWTSSDKHGSLCPPAIFERVHRRPSVEGRQAPFINEFQPTIP